jgi:hypothetical protein
MVDDQTTFIRSADAEALLEKWFPDNAKVQPPLALSKIEVHKPHGNRKEWRYVLFVWDGQRNYRVPVNVAHGQDWQLAAALALEQMLKS